MRRTVNFINSLEDPVYYASITGVNCESHPANPFGAVTGGHVTLRALTLTAKVFTTEQIYHSTKAYAYVEGCPKISPSWDVDCIPECIDLDHQQVTILWYDLPTGRGFERGLVLRRSHQGSAMYTRVGVMQHVPVDEWKDFWEEEILTIL